MKKKLNVVMLATQEKAKVEEIILLKTKANISSVEEGKLALCVFPGGSDLGNIWETQHLYFTSDEKCKNGDYFIDLLNTVRQFNDKTEQSINDKKIVITTDTSLYRLEDCPVRGGCSNVKYELPQPTKEFIDLFISEYNQGNIIKVVEVEYRHLGGTGSGYVLKANPDNTINISLIKDSFSREEVIRLIMKYALDEHDIVISPNTNKWIQENLK